MAFQLDARLANDCHQLAESEDSIYLLLNNSYFPWFIIVPKTQCTELYELTHAQQEQLQSEINLFSEFVTHTFECDKLNIASIGNIVKQMHIHIIARCDSDPCWPGVVWGTSFKREYEASRVVQIQSELKDFVQRKGINRIQFAQI